MLSPKAMVRPKSAMTFEAPLTSSQVIQQWPS
jgi:hypothetical protein